ncbi:MAG TPA: hypothetical protein VJK52_02410 [Candidatus Nanoarchaeia archaeon]|nr:hypothetical protein [Candidatus Nanoarchaeia archaeon]
MDPVRLNPPVLYEAPPVFPSSYVAAATALRKQHIKGLSTAQVMDAMLHAYECQFPPLREWLLPAWLDGYHDTVTSIRKCDTKIRIFPEDHFLTGLKEDHVLQNGGRGMSAWDFTIGNGYDFTVDELERAGVNRFLTKRQVIRASLLGTVSYTHCGWLAAADGDTHRLRYFTDMVAAECKRRNTDRMMLFGIPKDTGPTVWPLMLYGPGREIFAANSEVQPYPDQKDEQNPAASHDAQENYNQFVHDIAESVRPAGAVMAIPRGDLHLPDAHLVGFRPSAALPQGNLEAAVMGFCLSTGLDVNSMQFVPAVADAR